MKVSKNKCIKSIKENIYTPGTDKASKVVQIFLKNTQSSVVKEKSPNIGMPACTDKNNIENTVINEAIKNQCIAESEVEELLVQNQKLIAEVEKLNKIIKGLQSKVFNLSNEHNQLKINFLNLEKENCNIFGCCWVG